MFIGFVVYPRPPPFFEQAREREKELLSDPGTGDKLEVRRGVGGSKAGRQTNPLLYSFA